VSYPEKEIELQSTRRNLSIIRHYCALLGFYFEMLSPAADRRAVMNLLERVIYIAHQPPVPLTETHKDHMRAFFAQTDFGRDVDAFEVCLLYCNLLIPAHG
jgi:hypothetical protein